MRLRQRLSVWLLTSPHARLLLGLLLGSVLTIVISQQLNARHLVRPLYGVLSDQRIGPEGVCINADHDIQEANSGNDRTLCLPIPHDPATGRAIALPPAGTRVEAGLFPLPQDSWNLRELNLIYLVPEEPFSERVAWFFAPQCDTQRCYTATPEEAARLMVLSRHQGNLTRAEIEQGFQLQGTEPISQGVVVFYTRADYRVTEGAVQRFCARLVVRADVSALDWLGWLVRPGDTQIGTNERWLGSLTREHCADWPQSGPLQISDVDTELTLGPVLWAVYGHVTDSRLHRVEVVSGDGSVIGSSVQNDHFFVLVPGERSPREMRVFDETNQVVEQCDLSNERVCR